MLTKNIRGALKIGGLALLLSASTIDTATAQSGWFSSEDTKKKGVIQEFIGAIKRYDLKKVRECLYKNHSGQSTNYLNDWALDYKNVIMVDGSVKILDYISYEGERNKGEDDKDIYWLENEKVGWHHGIKMIKEDGEWRIYQISFLMKTR